MNSAFVRPKEVIDLVAGVIGLLFDRLDGEPAIDIETFADSQPTTDSRSASDSSSVSDFSSVSDDLTKINGIGPAYARRLAEAGVTTYGQLAGMTAEEIRRRLQIAEWQGDPEEWISQAAALKTK